MKITETDKSRMKFLLEMSLQQIDSVDSLTVDAGKDFQIESYIPYLLNDSRWPSAVDPLLIADPTSEPDKLSRAHAILNMVVTDPITKNTRFLDFGCGEGHIVHSASEKAEFSAGYDIKSHEWNFPKADNMVLTTNFEDVAKHAPYSTVLIYDVLDHVASEEEAIKCLSMVNSILADNGRVFLRCHPWCSRHGTHLYQKLNRAYVHMCLDEVALKNLGYEGLPTLKIIHPLQTYNKWIVEAGLKAINNTVVREVVEPFFQEAVIANLIKAHWKTSYDENLSSGRRFPYFQCEQQFVDYILTK